MRGQGAGHGWDHVQRVRMNAMKIAEHMRGLDCLIVELAALLHDIGDAKFHDGQERSGEFSREILTGLAVDRDVIDQIVHIVDNISFRKGESAEPLSPEGEVVQDADRLEALGAIGIVRTIEYGASFDQPFYSSDPNRKTGVDHFYEKLFKLHDLMNTEAAKQEAKRRELFMRSFLDQFMDECGQISDAARE
ncbi:MAG: HD domain-containing protein [Planctomycetota bacterium]